MLVSTPATSLDRTTLAPGRASAGLPPALAAGQRVRAAPVEGPPVLVDLKRTEFPRRESQGGKTQTDQYDVLASLMIHMVSARRYLTDRASYFGRG